jgi:predicted phosphodiesterase
VRIAVLADVHGNLYAFEAALAHVRAHGVDQIVLLGDLTVGSPDAAACWQLACSLGCPSVWGNHERYVAYYGTAGADPRWRGEQYAPVAWAVSELSPSERSAMRALPHAYRTPDAPGVLFCHASLRSDRDTVAAHTPGDRLCEMYPDVTEALIVRGHNHLGQVRLWDGHTIVTAGSVGLPLDSYPTAQYLLLEREGRGWQISHHSVPYDVDAAVRRFEETGYLDAAGPMGRLFQREVATASHQIVPFLRAYERWSSRAHVTLGDAVARYLATSGR